MKNGKKRQDIFPQILTVSTNVAGAVSDYVVQKFALPVSRVGTSRNKAQVIEILWVDHYPAILDAADTTAGFVSYLAPNTSRATGDTCTVNTVQEDVEKAEVMALVYRRQLLTTDGILQFTMPYRVDMTDGCGNGTLVATSQLSLVYGNFGGTTEANTTIKLCYRIVEVGITEYVGIVESQSSVIV